MGHPIYKLENYSVCTYKMNEYAFFIHKIIYNHASTFGFLLNRVANNKDKKIVY